MPLHSTTGSNLYYFFYIQLLFHLSPLMFNFVRGRGLKNGLLHLKKGHRFSRPRSRHDYSRLGRVWLLTSRLGTGKPITFFYIVAPATRLGRYSPYHSYSPSFMCPVPRDWWGRRTTVGVIVKNNRVTHLRDSVTRFFASGFFHESVPPPQPQSIPLRPFRIFSKIPGDIRGSRFATGVNDTGGKWKK